MARGGPLSGITDSAGGEGEKKLHPFTCRVSRVLAYRPQLLDRFQALLEMAFFAGTTPELSLWNRSAGHQPLPGRFALSFS